MVLPSSTSSLSTLMGYVNLSMLYTKYSNLDELKRMYLESMSKSTAMILDDTSIELRATIFFFVRSNRMILNLGNW